MMLLLMMRIPFSFLLKLNSHHSYTLTSHISIQVAFKKIALDRMIRGHLNLMICLS